MTPSERSWTLREIAVVAVIGLVFAMLYLGWVQIWLVTQAAIGPLAMDAMMGFWFVASPIAAAIIRRPGAALAAETLAAAIEVLMGSPVGLLLILAGLVQGAGAEAGLALFRWRRFDRLALMVSGLGAAIFSFVYTWIRFEYGALAPDLLVAMFTLRCLSGALLGGLLGWWIAEALQRSGALSGLPIDRARRSAGA
ncbi:MAG TPA: ECF transporter S component [Paracoccaceae bacterium]|nr:ECF transporter S component [Paracoccaceae bacterium]